MIFVQLPPSSRRIVAAQDGVLRWISARWFRTSSRLTGKKSNQLKSLEICNISNKVFSKI